MNTPGTGSGNWKWRFTEDQICKEKLQEIRELTSVFGRAPDKEKKQILKSRIEPEAGELGLK
jgi:4-alpha-glucanotransferase